MIPLRDDQPSFSTPFITYFLIAVNVLVFLWELSVGFHSHHTLNAVMFQFGVVPQHTLAVLTGHSYQSPAFALLPIFTSMFLHGSFFHVAGNMLFLWIFGDNVEDYLGHFRYLLFYLGSGFAGAIAHILMNMGSRVPTIGASGAIAGVMGAYIVLYPHARVLTWFVIFLWRLPAWLVLGYWFFVQWIMATTSPAGTSQVAVWAHVGGFLTGVLLIKVLPERPRRYRYGTW
jgi:membrane associated rhomboid family serine protease